MAHSPPTFLRTRMLHHTPSPFPSPERHTESGDSPQMVFLWLRKGELVTWVGFGEGGTYPE